MHDALGDLSAAETQELRRLYFAQAHEILEELQDVLLRVEADPGAVEEFKVFKRLLHTLKGDSNSMGFETLGHLAHRLEDILADCGNGEEGRRGEGLGILLAGLDEMRRLLAAGETGEEGAPAEDLTRTMERFEADAAPPRPGAELTEYQELQIHDALARGLNVFAALVTFHRGCGEPEVAAAMLAERLGRIGEVIHVGPIVEGRQRLVVGTGLMDAEVRECLLLAGITTGADVRPLTSAGAAPEPVRAPAPAANAKSEILRVESGKVDRLLDLVGELIIGRSMLGQAAREIDDGVPAPELAARLLAVNAYLERTVADLHKGVMTMRMVPVQQLFRKFPRVLRDLAAQMGKKVRLEVEGEETELDKGIVEALGEPLTHIVRNLLDHGIEPVAERVALGKPAEGKVRLRAYQEGSQIVIEAADDGRGIATAKLKARALELGMMSAAELERLSEAEAQRLIFLSGLSTAAQVSETSGRGVGMDAVKCAVEGMKGRIEIDSRPERGTTFRLRLPITLAVIKALLFECGTQLFAIPVSAIAEVAKVTTDELLTVDGRPTLLRRNQTLSVIRLGDLLRIAAAEGAKKFVLALSLGGRRVGLLIDRLLWQQELVIKPVDGRFLNSTLVAGASILGDGKVVFILDAGALFEKAVAVEKQKMVGA